MKPDSRANRRVKLHDLHILMTVVQEGSMGKAAERLHTVQPAISRSIAKLESTIGFPLLDRSHLGIEPTAYGRALLDCGAAVFDDLRLGLDKIEFLADPAVGEVRVGSIVPLAAGFVSGVIDRLARRFPRIVFHVLSAQVEALRQELGQRNLDLVIAPTLGIFEQERFEFEKLYFDRHTVVAGANNPWARRRKVRLADLMREAWTLPPLDTAIGAVTMEAFRASGAEYPHTTVFTVSPEVRMRLLATGRYLTILPASSLQFPTRRPDLKAVAVELPLEPVDVGIITLRGRSITPTAQLFIEHAHELAKPLPR